MLTADELERMKELYSPTPSEKAYYEKQNNMRKEYNDSKPSPTRIKGDALQKIDETIKETLKISGNWNECNELISKIKFTEDEVKEVSSIIEKLKTSEQAFMKYCNHRGILDEVIQK